MSDMLSGLKNDKNKLPFPIPGEVSYEDFTENRFQTCDSRSFIRPVLYIQALVPPKSERFCIPVKEDCCLLLYIKEGQVNAEKEAESFHLSAGSGLFTSADCPVYLKNKKAPLSCVIFLLKGALTWDLYKLQAKKVISFDRYEYPDFEQRLNPLLHEYLDSESPLLFVFSRHMDFLISRIIQLTIRKEHQKEMERKQSLMSAVTYMRENCCDQIQVGDIAAAFGYSSSHFSRIFQTEFHQSPKRYLLNLRIAHAEKLLTTSDRSIEHIGQECGFNTTAHFIQIFRDTNDLTPLQYRKMHLSEKGQTKNLR